MSLVSIKNKKFNIQNFCDINNVECTREFDFNGHWTEIYVDGYSVFQIDGSTSSERFIELVRYLNTNWIDSNIDNEFPDFWFTVNDRELFDKFIAYYNSVFIT